MTEQEVIERMKTYDLDETHLAYDARIPGYFLCGKNDWIQIEREIVVFLCEKKIIIDDEVIHGGSVQLYSFNKKI